jgi:hypothetical protein
VTGVREDRDEADASRRGSAARLGALLRPGLAREARRRGFAEVAVLTDWALIVGTALASRCQPVRLRFARGSDRAGTLVVHAMGGTALELQHGAPQVIQRINQYFGREAVATLRIVQAPAAAAVRPAAPAAPRSLAPATLEAIDAAVADIAAEDLRRALAGLGRAVHAAGPR